MYALILCAVLVLFPSAALHGAGLGLEICLSAVVPSLLPFMLISSLVIENGWGERLGRLLRPVFGPIFGLNAAGSMCLVTGLLGGYPCGARAAAQSVEKGLMSRRDGEAALAFCNNSGPLFIIGTAGVAVYGSTKIGAMLYLCHAAGALTAAFIFGRKMSAGGPTAKSTVAKVPIGAAVGRAAKDSGAAIVGVCALVITFSALIEALQLYRLPLLVGLFEVSRGVKELGAYGATALPLSAAYLSWGGLSVHFQTEAVAGGLSKKYYYAGKAVSAVSAGAACIALRALHIL